MKHRESLEVVKQNFEKELEYLNSQLSKAHRWWSGQVTFADHEGITNEMFIYPSEIRSILRNRIDRVVKQLESVERDIDFEERPRPCL